MLDKIARVMIFAGIALFGLRGVLPDLAAAGWLQELESVFWVIAIVAVIGGSIIWLFKSVLQAYSRTRTQGE